MNTKKQGQGRNIMRTFARLIPAVAAATLATLVSAPALSQRTHTVMPGKDTVHIGNFNAGLKPVLTIDSGDIVELESAGAIAPSAVDASGVVPPSAVPAYVREAHDLKDRGPGGHVLT